MEVSAMHVRLQTRNRIIRTSLQLSVRLVFAALVGLLISVHCRAASQRAIPDDNLAYPVLIKVESTSSGSGFFLNTPDSVFLVTAKHVLFDPQTHALLSPYISLLCYSKDQADPTKDQFAVNLLTLQTSGDVRSHPTQDVVVVRLFRITPTNAPVQSSQPPPARSIQSNESTPRQIVPLPGVTILSMA